MEKVYERALAHELKLRGLKVEAQTTFRVVYKGHSVGEYAADLVVGGAVVVELKCAARLGAEHVAQGLNYLRASGMPVCLLINFQNPKVEWRRLRVRGNDGLAGNCCFDTLATAVANWIE